MVSSAHVHSILRFTGMIAFVTNTFKELDGPATTERTWLRDFKDLIASLELTSHSVTSLLAIISGAITSGKPLPPYLTAPDRYHIDDLLSDLDSDILRTTHVCEPGYAAFAVMQVSTTMLAEDLAELLADTKILVGEAEFNMDIVQEDYEKNVGTGGGIRVSTKED